MSLCHSKSHKTIAMACHLQGWTARWLVESLSKHFTHFHTASEVYLGKSLCQCSTWKRLAHKVIACNCKSTIFNIARRGEWTWFKAPTTTTGRHWMAGHRQSSEKTPQQIPNRIQLPSTYFEYHWMPKSYDKFTLDYGWRARLLCHVWRTIDRSFAVFAQMALWGSQPLITRTCMELSWSQEWPASLLSFSQMYRV